MFWRSTVVRNRILDRLEPCQNTGASGNIGMGTGRDVQNLIMLLRVIVTLLVTPAGPPLAR